MSTRIWSGNSPSVAQVNTITTGGVAALNQTYTVTINGKTVTYTALVADTNALITAGLLLLLQASVYPEFLEITWAAGATNLIINATSVTAGVPFTQTSSSAGGTLVTATPTASSGPNDASIATNWSGATLPVNGDTVVFDSSNVDCLYGLTALAAVTTVTLQVNASYTGKIGLPTYNGRYYEYRPQYLQFLGATLASIGYGPGTGSGRIKLDFQGSTATVNVVGAAPPFDATLGVRWAVLLKGTNASNVVSVNRGTVGIAALPSEVSTALTLNVGYVQNVAGDAVVYCGTGATLTTVNQAGGNLTTQSAVTTLVQTAGTWTHLAGLVTTATVAGTWYAQAAGTFYTTASILGGGVLDCTQDMRNRTGTNALQLYKGSKFNDPYGTTFNGGPLAFKTVQCSLADVKVTVGNNRVYTPA